MKIVELDPKEIRRLQAFLAKVAVRMEAGGNEDIEALYGNGSNTEYCSMHPSEAFHPHSQYRLVQKRREEFKNIYPPGSSPYYHRTRAKADKAAGFTRIECLHMREVFPGEE